MKLIIGKIIIPKEALRKANRKGSREAEIENSIGFTSRHKVHKSAKIYNRKSKHQLELI